MHRNVCLLRTLAKDTFVVPDFPLEFEFLLGCTVYADLCIVLKAMVTVLQLKTSFKQQGQSS